MDEVKVDGEKVKQRARAIAFLRHQALAQAYRFAPLYAILRQGWKDRSDWEEIPDARRIYRKLEEMIDYLEGQPSIVEHEYGGLRVRIMDEQAQIEFEIHVVCHDVNRKGESMPWATLPGEES